MHRERCSHLLVKHLRKGKPSYLFHGTTVPNLHRIEPRRGNVPRALGRNVPPAVYATDDQVYAAAHAIYWYTAQGFMLFYEKGKAVFLVPKRVRRRLEQKIYIYTVPSGRFSLMKEVTPYGRNYRSLVSVKPVEVISFASVTEAFEYFGGTIGCI